MIIESIELKNYRNYEELHMELNEGTNILYGDNAQGKTNILEAVYVCCTSKSHKNAKDRDIIRFDQDESHIKMQIRKNDVPYRIDMHLKKKDVYKRQGDWPPEARLVRWDCSHPRKCIGRAGKDVYKRQVHERDDAVDVRIFLLYLCNRYRTLLGGTECVHHYPAGWNQLLLKEG